MTYISITYCLVKLNYITFLNTPIPVRKHFFFTVALAIGRNKVEVEITTCFFLSVDPCKSKSVAISVRIINGSLSKTNTQSHLSVFERWKKKRPLVMI